MAKKRPKKKNKKTMLIASIVTIIIVLFAISSFLAYNNVLAYYEYETSVTVGDYVGINLDTDKIHFGTTFPGGHSKREITINTTTPGYVFLSVSGPMDNMVQTFDQFSYVEEGEQKPFELYAAPSEDAKEGIYNSTVHVYILKKRCFLLEMFLKGKPVSILGAGDPVPNQGGHIKLNISQPNMTINAS